MTISKISLPFDLDYKLSTIYRGEQHPTEIIHKCNVPLNAITIDSKSRIFLCECDGWLPISVGVIQDFNSIKEILNSDISKTLQKNVQEKQYTWCAIKHCDVINRDRLLDRMHITVNIDESCNLQCPSCRRESIMIDHGPEFENKLRDVHKLMSWLDAWNDPVLITLTGNGDALASHIIRPLILRYRPKHNMKFELKSNGLLLEKIMSKSTILANVENYSISVDAATASTYEDVRRPGRWKDLLRNLQWLQKNKGSARVDLNFVVQKKNYREIPDFIHWCKQLEFAPCFVVMNDWGTWNAEHVDTPDTWTIKNGYYYEHNILDPNHPEHVELKNILKALPAGPQKFFPSMMRI